MEPEDISPDDRLLLLLTSRYMEYEEKQGPPVIDWAAAERASEILDRQKRDG